MMNPAFQVQMPPPLADFADPGIIMPVDAVAQGLGDSSFGRGMTIIEILPRRREIRKIFFGAY